MPNKNKTKKTLDQYMSDPRFAQYDQQAEWNYLSDFAKQKLREKNPDVYDTFVKDVAGNRSDPTKLNTYYSQSAAMNYDAQPLSDEELKSTFAKVKGVNGTDSYQRFKELQKELFSHDMGLTERNNFSGYGLKDVFSYRPSSYGTDKGEYYRPKVVDGAFYRDSNIPGVPSIKPEATMPNDVASYAMGTSGTRGHDVKVDNNEFAVTPEGSKVQFKGNPNVTDGIDVNLPEGTKIFSDDIKFQGSSLADRAKRRALREKRIMDMLEGNEQDAIGKNTLKRTIRQNQIQEENDLLYQDVVNGNMPDNENAEQVPNNEQTEGYAGGTDYLDPNSRWGGYDQRVNLGPTMGYNGGYYPGKPLDPTPTPNGLYTPPIDQPANVLAGNINPVELNNPNNVGAFNNYEALLPNANNANPANSSQQPIEDGNNTMAGNVIGGIGLAVNAVAPILTTIANAKNTKPVQNRYQGYGKDALDINEAAQDAIAFLEQENDINQSIRRNTEIQGVNNSTRSLNVSKALKSMIDFQSDRNSDSADAEFAGKKAGLVDSRGRISLARDAAVAQGQTQADDKNQQNVDNFYTNLNKDLGNVGTSIEQFGSNLNQTQYQNDMMQLLGDLSKYGISYKRDKKGKLIQTVR